MPENPESSRSPGVSRTHRLIVDGGLLAIVIFIHYWTIRGYLLGPLHSPRPGYRVDPWSTESLQSVVPLLGVLFLDLVTVGLIVAVAVFRRRTKSA